MIKQKNDNKTFKDIQDHLKHTGFIFPNSEIYGGLANTYDYGPLGALLIKNIKDLWWQEFIIKEKNNYGFDAKTLLNPLIWKSSGHLDNFLDPLVENKVNKKRYRADHVIKNFDPNIDVEKMTFAQLETFLNQKIDKYDGAKTIWGPVRNFNLMFETYQGIIEEDKTKLYLRPELAQGIFVNYKNVQKTMRAKIPFGIGQIGHSFRNEITPRNFTFRTREFEQMELEYFVKPTEVDKAFAYYQNKITSFLKLLGLKKESYRIREHNSNELAHYSKKTVDFEYKFPFGWGEIIGLSNRGDFDLKAHMQFSKINLNYVDDLNKETFIPHVIEPSIGLDRLALALLVDSFDSKGARLVLKLNSKIAPFKIAVLPLIKKIHEHKAQEIFEFLINHNLSVTYDESGSIGKRYVRQDMIGTPFCISVDDKTLENNIITLRTRDSTNQIFIDYHEIFKHM